MGMVNGETVNFGDSALITVAVHSLTRLRAIAKGTQTRLKDTNECTVTEIRRESHAGEWRIALITVVVISVVISVTAHLLPVAVYCRSALFEPDYALSRKARRRGSKTQMSALSPKLMSPKLMPGM